MLNYGRRSEDPATGRHSRSSRSADSEDDRPLLSRTEQPKEGNPNQVRLDENSPLLEGQKPDDEETLLAQDPLGQSLTGQEEGTEETKSMWYLFVLTLSIGGLQIAWATELSNGSPFLLSLGLSKALLSFVWIAGPLTGVLVQPYVGMLSDRSRMSWGKRRPFMIAGSTGTILSLLALAWSRELVGGFLSLFGADPASQGIRTTTIIFAVAWVYILDFSINAVQAAIRAFIVDNAPTHQQEDANAWASRISGCGNIIGYLSGYVHLPKYFPFFGDTQFKVLCVFSAIALGSTVMISCLYIRERDPRLEALPKDEAGLGVVSFFRQITAAMFRLPPQIRKVCEVQFFNWIGWFPFLFYITTYIGQLKVNPIFEEYPDLSSDEINRQWEDATRVGSFALLVYAIISFIASIILPILIVPSYRPPGSNKPPEATSRLYRFLANFRIPHLTLRRAWLYSHILFAICMLCTFFVSTPVAGTVLVGIVGICWGLTMWAPFALIAAEISKRESRRRFRKAQQTRQANIDGAAGTVAEEVHDQAGVILGLHNVAVSAPQILATLISSGIFKLTQKDRGVAGDDSVGWVLRFGGLAALIAAFMTWRLGEERDEE